MAALRGAVHGQVVTVPAHQQVAAIMTMMMIPLREACTPRRVLRAFNDEMKCFDKRLVRNGAWNWFYNGLDTKVRSVSRQRR